MSLRGQDMRFYSADGYSSPTFTEIGEVDDLDFDSGFATVTFQSRDRSYKESKRGQGDPTITFTLNVSGGLIEPSLRNGSSFPGGIGLGDLSVAGTYDVFIAHFICTNFELTGEIDGVAQYSVTLKPDVNQGGNTGEPPAWIQETTV